MVSSYRDLIVWQKAMDLVVEVYRLTRQLPKDESFGLANQIRRAAVSIPSNIAEGYSRQAPKDYSRFLAIARGSKSEVETQLDISVRVGCLNESDIQKAADLCREVGSMLNAIIGKL